MGPFPLQELFGPAGAYTIHLFIGFAFGYVLEIAGFGDSPKLAAQFYFKDMTVLKVMFTAIIVAMVLIFLVAGLGFIDYNLLWVNPTYLVPGIIGGLIMGVGFIVGGFCPGTSLVAAATLKIDGFFFVFGVLFGIFAFGETVSYYDEFWNSTYLGRFTLMDLFDTSTGWVTLAIVIMAIFMFWGAEQLEKIFGNGPNTGKPKYKAYGAAALLVIVATIIFIGQPDSNQRWNTVAQEKQPLIDNRDIQIHPGELLEKIDDPDIRVIMLDVRNESDFNLFHIEHAKHIQYNELKEWIPSFLLEPSNTLFVVMSNDEATATEAWKYLIAESLPNVYVLDGGINYWLETFADKPETNAVDDQLRYVFNGALGSRDPAATPDPHEFELEYTPKVKMELKKGPSAGGCG